MSVTYVRICLMWCKPPPASASSAFIVRSIWSVCPATSPAARTSPSAPRDVTPDTKTNFPVPCAVVKEVKPGIGT